MRKTPCEIIVWYILPCIRKKMAEYMAEKLPQKEIAEKLGLSNAAISQYLSDKRGRNFKFDEQIIREIRKSADRIINGGDAIEETCRICNIIKKKINLEHYGEIC